METILECRTLTKLYGKKTALAGISLNIERGKIIGLLGPNGSGKTTLIKLACGLLVPTSGGILVDGQSPGVESKLKVAYLPDKNYIPDWMNVTQLLKYFSEFYTNFNVMKATEMLEKLGIGMKDKFKAMSKGTKEKVQLITVMSREADLYLLDEPIAGVDPAARDYILNTIISNYNPQASVVISTHLIADVETVLDEFIFIQNGTIRMHSTVDEIRETQGKSVDALFREVYKC
ncbi:MAG: ABC transporter ATP-binding protein [Oscillospiraceae bacterium]|jgi:ABC-2 type transport system ATP-binding protein